MSPPSSARTIADVPWPRIPEGVVLLVPVGSTEQHGGHLPLDVDTVIARAVCAGAARDAGDAGVDVRVAPALAYGSSGEHQGFPGTLSIGTAALEFTLLELGRSARSWVGRLVFVNGHGGNIEALESAVRTLRAEGDAASWIPCRHGDGHAGRAETSLMLHLDPARVDLDAAQAGPSEPMRALLPRLRAEGVRAVSPGGVLGDPAGASAAEGDALLRRMTAEVLAQLAAAGD